MFELGHTYLQLVQTLNLRLPLVDPSHYISRFAALLEFGDETPQVALDATRLVQRFDRDWMTRGRRPSGICGAALLLAARMNNFRRSVEEIVQVVKIADSTLRKRVEEFRRTGSAELSVADFRSVWLEEEMDPPAYIKGKEREAAEAEAAAAGKVGEGTTSKGKGKGKGRAKGKGKKRKRKRGEESEEELGTEPVEESPAAPMPIDPTLLNQGILAGTIDTDGILNGVDTSTSQSPSQVQHKPPPLFFPDVDEQLDSEVINLNANIDPAFLDPALLASPPDQHSTQSETVQDTLPFDEPILPPTPPLHVSPSFPPPSPTQVNPEDEEPSSKLDVTLDNFLTTEVSSFLETDQGISLSSALDHAETVRQSQFVGLEVDELQGLDEDELDAFILTEDEVKIKERVWVELNKDYLEALAGTSPPVHFEHRPILWDAYSWLLLVLLSRMLQSLRGYRSSEARGRSARRWPREEKSQGSIPHRDPFYKRPHIFCVRLFSIERDVDFSFFLVASQDRSQSGCTNAPWCNCCRICS